MQLWRNFFVNPWNRPRFLVVITWCYVIWTIVPVVITVLFSFNAGRSISVWQGFNLTRWYVGDPVNSILHDSGLRSAFFQTLKLAGLDILIATPLGVLLAVGLARWQGYGRRPANFLMLIPLVTPELVLGVAIYLVFKYIYLPIEPSTLAQVLGQVTFMTPFVVLVTRGRLQSIGRQYEEAAADLGASPWGSIILVLLPLLLPAILASIVVVFALAIDNFVIAQWLSCGAECATISITVYDTVRGAPLPSIDALASIMIFLTLATVALGYVLYRFLSRGERNNTNVGDFM